MIYILNTHKILFHVAPKSVKLRRWYRHRHTHTHSLTHSEATGALIHGTIHQMNDMTFCRFRHLKPAGTYWAVEQIKKKKNKLRVHQEHCCRKVAVLSFSLLFFFQLLLLFQNNIIVLSTQAFSDCQTNSTHIHMSKSLRVCRLPIHCLGKKKNTSLETFLLSVCVIGWSILLHSDLVDCSIMTF